MGDQSQAAGLGVGITLALDQSHLATLTTRVLRIALPPDEGWVIVVYQTTAGAFAEIQIEWMVNPPLPSGEGGNGGEARDLDLSYALGLDLESSMPSVFEARSVTTPGGTFGDIRIRTFVAEVEEFVEEFSVSSPRCRRMALSSMYGGTVAGSSTTGSSYFECNSSRPR